MGGVDFHTYGQMILTQPGWVSRGAPEDSVPEAKFAELLTLGNTMSEAIRNTTGMSDPQHHRAPARHRPRRPRRAMARAATAVAAAAAQRSAN